MKHFTISLLMMFGCFFGFAQTSTPGTWESLETFKTGSTRPSFIAANRSAELAGALAQIFSSTGHYTMSADGKGSTNSSMTIRVSKPNTLATVQKVFLISSAVSGRTIANGCVTLSGVPVNWNDSATSGGGYNFNNYWADVTSIVAGQINSFPAGISNLTITECNSGSIDGEALLVVFNDPTATEKTIIVKFGAGTPAGDNFPVTLAQPIDPVQPGALLDMGLGIGFSYQASGGGQASHVSVNGQRLSSSAGGEDDGAPANGALITVGGIGDVNTNPSNPNVGPSNPRTDDELYNILPFITSITTTLNINTANPTADDNIFLAYFMLSGAAIIGEGILLSQTTTSGNVGTTHTVKAVVKNSDGLPQPNKLVTFTITSGPNAGISPYSTNTDANGEAYFTYTGSAGVGIDKIEVCFTNSQSQLTCSNSLSFQWGTPPPPPTVSCPANSTGNNGVGQCGANISYTPASAAGTPTPTITYSHASGSFFPVGITTVTATATNINGSTNCQFTITVVDNQPPSINCPLSVTLQCASAVPAVDIASVTASDNCNGIITVTHVSDIISNQTYVNKYTITRTYKATDAAGNFATCTQTITVNDNTAPVITCPAPITLNAGLGVCGATVTYTVASADNCSGQVVTRTAGLASGSVFPVGTTTNSFLVTDASNNTATCSFTITVTDNENPSINCAPNLTRTADAGVCTAMITVVGPATGDNCAVLSVTNNYTHTSNASGVYPVGTTTLTWTVTDIHGNSSTCTQTITVTDNENPSINCSPNLTRTVDAGVCTAMITVVGPATGDNCAVFSVINNYTNTSNASGVYPSGITTLTWTVTDIHGNSSTCTQTITVTDNENPSINCAPNQTQTAAAGVCTAMITVVGPATGDNCAVSSVTNNYTNTSNASGVYPAGITTLIWTVTDIHGNSSTCTQTVTVTDNEAPALNPPAGITLGCGSSLLPSNTGMATATDNCTTPANIILSYEDDKTLSACGGTITRTWKAIDASNNQTTAIQTITVSPAILPTMTAPTAVTISVVCGATPVPTTISFSNGLSGGCLISGTSNLSTFIAVAGTCGGTLTETWTATDNCGRTIASVSRTITVSQNIGNVQSFVLFSGSGAVSNTGNSTITGDVGTDLGLVSGFDPPSTLNGGMYSATALTTQAKIDLLNLYIHLSNIPVTNTTHAAVFGNGETITAGVYTIPAAGSMAGNLNLDGQGDSNAIIILKFSGAFSPAAGSTITLINNLRASNVFWIAEAAISIGATATMKGTFIAHSGAASMGAGGNLEGRLLSTFGAVSFGPGIAYLPAGSSTLPVICVNTCNSSILGSAAGFTLFTTAGAVSNTGSSGIIGNIGTGAGAITGFGTSATTLVGNFYNADAVAAQATIDLQAGYTTLINTATTNNAHAPVFGNGETLTPGVYAIGAAGSLAGTLTLDGGGNTNAQFIFKFGGAFVAAAQSKIILVNGASHCNVFWVAEGAVSIGALSFMKGSFIANNAANTMGANGNLEGSLFSTAGAIGFNTGVGYNSYTFCTSPAKATPVMANPFVTKTKSKISAENKLPVEPELLNVLAYPNPSASDFSLILQGGNNEKVQVVVYDVMGKPIKTFEMSSIEQTIRFGTDLRPGIYLAEVIQGKNRKTIKLVKQ